MSDPDLLFVLAMTAACLCLALGICSDLHDNGGRLWCFMCWTLAVIPFYTGHKTGAWKH